MLEEYGYIFPYKRVKIPFRERREKVRWPNGNIIAVHVYIALEVYGRKTVPAGVAPQDIAGATDIGSLSEQDNYNLDVGIWRALDLLDKYQIKGTVFTNGAVAQYRPEIVREVNERGHEIAGHGYYESRASAMMNPEQEREDITKTTKILESVSGQRPRGWINPWAACSEYTFELLAELGYLWHGDLRDDDLPYGIKVKDKVLVEVPHRTGTTNDFAFFAAAQGLFSSIKALRSSREAVRFFEDTFSDYYETAKVEWPQSLTLGIHPFNSCLPDRVRALDSMIRYMKGFRGVWFTTYSELAQWWKDNYL